MRQICNLVFILIGLAGILFVITTAGSSSADPQDTRLSLTLGIVSSKTAGFEKVSWMLNLAIESFAASFDLPDDRISLHLALYLSCADVPSHPPTPVLKRDIQSAYGEYVTTVFRAVGRSSKLFDSVEYFCSGMLSSAVCHLQTKVSSGNTDFIFFLEHDWVILPSRIKSDAYSLVSFLESNEANISYVLLQRGDRPHKSVVLHEVNGMQVLKSSQYSNNPFLAGEKFFSALTQSSSLCTSSLKNPMGG